MPATKDYQHGSTIYMPGGGTGMHERAKRTHINGWSKSAVRRHTQWLWSINTEKLDGYGYATTLTMRDCPPSSEVFHTLRTSYLKRMARMGAIRTHWVVEWQRRKVPHLHMAIYFDRELTGLERFQLVDHWVQLVGPYGVSRDAQEANPIESANAWNQYVSKHAARGADHYQRQGKPAGWEKTGRLWGHTGTWPEEEPFTFDVPDEAYFRYRRLVRSWRVADSRMEKDPLTRARRIRSARRMLRCTDRKLSTVRGCSEWMPQAVTLKLLDLLADQGAHIRQIS